MKNLQREDLNIIIRHTSLTEKEAENILTENIYNKKADWQKFLRLFFITLGIGFTTAGIIFFFAYNWADLHKFTKIGLVEGLIIATTVIALLPKIKRSTRNIILTGSSFLVGVLFAVFGQIYQTGANAYDFFLAWTIFIAIWVIVSNFAPLWLLFVVLINTTFILYSQQVAKDWSEVFVLAALFVFNALILLSSILLVEYKKIESIPVWFTHILALGTVTFATFGMIVGIMDDFQIAFPFLVALTVIVFSVGILYGLKSKSGFYLSVIPFSVIIIISSLFLKISEGGGMFLIVSLFIVISITLVIMNLISLQKKWKNEE
jgi:uncharacterized membrane protein